MQVLSREQVRNLDRIAVERFGIPGPILMENAGRGAVDAMEITLPGHMKLLPFIGIVAGKGNNGGDGYVMARHLTNRDFLVEIVLLGDRESYRGDGEAAMNLEIAERMGIRVVSAGSADLLLEYCEGFELIVDAVLGTGLQGEVRGFAREAIDVINDVGLERPVFAADIPSGLDCDTGKPLGTAVRATATATFAAMKKGFLNADAGLYTGPVQVVDIGCPVVWE
ncbi:MAG: NAD(P)H-hydrate epimerase [Acidobacteriota bacterium]